MAGDLFYGQAICVIILLEIYLQVTVSSATAHLSIKFISYSNRADVLHDGSECDGVGSGPCDPFFELAVYEGSSKEMLRIFSRVYQDEETITFDSNFGYGVSNPIIVDLPYWSFDGYQLILKAIDEDLQYDDVIEDWFESVKVLGQRRITLEKNNDIKLILEVNGYCSPDYYGANCKIYCQSQEEHICNKTTGERLCHPGAMCDKAEKDCQLTNCDGNGEQNVGRTRHSSKNIGKEYWYIWMSLFGVVATIAGVVVYAKFRRRRVHDNHHLNAQVRTGCRTLPNRPIGSQSKTSIYTLPQTDDQEYSPSGNTLNNDYSYCLSVNRNSGDGIGQYIMVNGTTCTAPEGTNEDGNWSSAGPEPEGNDSPHLMNNSPPPVYIKNAIVQY